MQKNTQYIINVIKNYSIRRDKKFLLMKNLTCCNLHQSAVYISDRFEKMIRNGRNWLRNMYFFMTVTLAVSEVNAMMFGFLCFLLDNLSQKRNWINSHFYNRKKLFFENFLGWRIKIAILGEFSCFREKNELFLKIYLTRMGGRGSWLLCPTSWI